MIQIEPTDHKYQEEPLSGGETTIAMCKIQNKILELIMPELGGNTSVDLMMGKTLLRTPDDYQEALVALFDEIRDTILPNLRTLDVPKMFHNDASASLIDAFMGERLTAEQAKLAEEQFVKVGSAMKPASQVREESVQPLVSMSLDDYFD